MRTRTLFVTILLFFELSLSLTAGLLPGEIPRRIGMAVALSLPLLFLRRAPEGTPPLSLLPPSRRTLPYLLLFPSFVLLNALVSLGTAALLRLLGLPAEGATPLTSLPLMLLFDAFIPAVLEELFFRGAVFSALRPMGRWAAVLGSGLLFALMHANLAQLPYALMSGILLALLLEATGSLLFPIVFHIANNLLSLCLLCGFQVEAFFLTLGGAALLTLPPFVLLAKGGLVRPLGSAPKRPFVRELFLSPLLLWIAVILSITLL